MKIERFEDLQCWQEARKSVGLVYQAIGESMDFEKDLRLCGQITGAAISSMSNIAEGFSRKSNKGFIQYYITEKAFHYIYEQAERVSKLDSGLITYLLQNQKKFKPNQLIEPNEPQKPKKPTT